MVDSIKRFNQIELKLRQNTGFQELIQCGNPVYTDGLNLYGEYLRDRAGEDVMADIAEIRESPVLDETEKQILTSARCGQGA